MSKQVNFNLDEESEINFKLSVKGSTNLPNVRPVIRFIISENSENGIAVVIPAHSTDEGVVVTIPSLKNVFSEDKEYIGKLEIIVGNRYFAPTAMNIGFTKAFDIQAEAIIHENNPPFHVESIKTSGEVLGKKEKEVEFNVQQKKKPVVVKETVQQQKSSIDDISDDVLDALTFDIAPPVKKPTVNQPKEIKKPVVSTDQKQPVKQSVINQKPLKKDTLIKEQFKNLLRDALK